MENKPITSQDLIPCPKCGLELIYIRGGEKEKGEFWEAYWRCQNRCYRNSTKMFTIKESEAKQYLKKRNLLAELDQARKEYYENLKLNESKL